MEKITQFEFDNLMNAIRQEQNENNEKMRAELHEIEARKQLDDYHAYYKGICNEIAQKQKELKAANAEYYERKKALIKAFPKAIGVPTDKPLRLRDCHAMRRKLIAQMQEKLKDVPGIDIEHINVQFTFDGESVTFETIIPKTA